ncbi:MAG: transcriptional regulator [Sphaerisporangium sp.]|nr:transcriptional regulator [Sphaerisporangium sp.]
MLERRITETFVELADTLVVGFDVIDLLHTLTERCVDLLEVDAAGILLADQRGTMALVAASTEQARLLELFQLQDEEGPGLEAYHSRQAVVCADLGARPQRWPLFTAAAREQGFAAVTAVPLRLREQALGAMSLFRHRAGGLPPDTLATAQALADVATIGILHERALHHSAVVTEQLQHALNSRVIIEQAKGVLSERGQIGVEDAFTLLRGYARNHGLELSALARDVVTHQLGVADLLGDQAPPTR